jgi:hypothetical protein
MPINREGTAPHCVTLMFREGPALGSTIVVDKITATNS